MRHVNSVPLFVSPVHLRKEFYHVRSCRFVHRIPGSRPLCAGASEPILQNLKLLFMLQRTFRLNQFAILNLVTRR
jgi:hypothetical protein